ncbi:acetyltransferase [Matsumuraeses phaseoli granulovirus]|uniref:Acetyltransferase n=1 Tax=Matsumuraeses phaseoli granulovirus TaxID=2760664 RepID=A0AAE7MLD7_9BBAC|nr:acetyltransferase [Matsumuraeses phaseoli granulovirus]QOD40021.1 acetyltransferase [Matsumuraeses phaseoli granulovirus]
MMDIAATLIPFGDNTKSYKATHHHYCGFYSLYTLDHIVDDFVAIGRKKYKVSDETVIDWAYDGVDTIVSEKRLVYSKEEWPLHSLIHNIYGQILGIVTRGYLDSDDQYCYAVHNGYALYNNHLSDTNLIVREKTKPIVYADQQFDTKRELLHYLDTLNSGQTSGESGAILYHTNRKHAQLVLYRDGKQLSNCHLRKPLYGLV